MKVIHRGNRVLALAFFLAVSQLMIVSVVQAEGDEGIPVRLFESQGIMRYVDPPSGTVQIDNMRYRLAYNMTWYGVDSEASLVPQLHRAVNGKVAYIIDSQQKAPTVKAIWILPSEGR